MGRVVRDGDMQPVPRADPPEGPRVPRGSPTPIPMNRILLLAALALAVSACGPADDATVETDDNVSVAGEMADDGVSEAGTMVTEPSAPFNLNTATAEQFATIPGVGERMIHEFEEYRPYKDLAQFDREIGKYVEPPEVARLRSYVTLP